MPSTNYRVPPIQITGFNGLYSRGTNDTCPQDHLQKCNNCIFPGKSQVSIREPITISTTIAGRNIISYQVVTPASGPVLLTLDISGVFRDETSNVTLISLANPVDDFVTLSIFGRVYISFKYLGKAYTGTALGGASAAVVWWYDGTTFNSAGGFAPVGLFTATASGTGVVTAGTHNVAVAYETATGFITKLSVPRTVTVSGTQQIALTSVLIGPAGTKARYIFMTQANQTEYFFVPGGVINDNTTTTFNINVTDLALTKSADYLFDIGNNVPACSAMRYYNGRMVYIGQIITPDITLVSNQLDPETVDLVTGTVILPQDFGVNTTNTGAIIRDVLYLMKPNGTYATQDNGGDPATWSVTQIDSGLGTFENGISLFGSSMSGQDILDQCLVLSLRGLILFNGSFADPPLTYKIEGLWQLIDYTQFYKCKIAHDVYNKRIYIIVPVFQKESGSVVSMMFMGDYVEGLSATGIKWSMWDINALTSVNAISKIQIDNFSLSYGTTVVYYLTFCIGGPSIYKFQPPATNYFTPLYGDLPVGAPPASYPINQIIQTADMSFGDGINIFTNLSLTINGIGPVMIVLLAKNYLGAIPPGTPGVVSTAMKVPGFELTNYNPRYGNGTFLNSSGQILYRPINFLMETCSIYLDSNSMDAPGTPPVLGNVSFFNVSKIELYGSVKFRLRPTVAQNV